ncbi:histidine kinase dimerization/phosphoacceptor domain -containing protein [Gymnodinialimonas ceratoperidinii]|uniref:GAF domain-containing protein n=1 Tax=Gymnodinialimonas ceratoperidinii TaxID=2856823 RepID=A0A8F6YC36_9RHOB|nr:histidine kinase dimerization/phosphoacceptor domain -containing protein [Gymnodinialimonas ceratoperidinii]QXT38875.1 GAF domain-containing protein [Gymnodinialimonas ceratoperidinii]
MAKVIDPAAAKGYVAAPHPSNDQRVAALHSYGILDTPRDAEYDAVVELIARICDVPFAVINFIDEDRQWFKAEVGLGTRELPLDESICAHAILLDDFMEIEDTLNDDRLCGNPLCVSGPNLRFYAGALLKTAEGMPLGTLCVLDQKPRVLTDLQRDAVKVMAAQVMRQMELALALRREELLRLEVDHRVKNSLQSVSAMARIQSRMLTDEAARDALQLMQQRVEIIAALHTALYKTNAGERINISAYLASVADLIRGTLHPNQELALSTGCNKATITSQEAGALGLIVAELTANSQKHGFADGRAGKMTLDLSTAEDGELVLTYTDDGLGSAAPKSESSTGMGMSVIDMLSEQLGGVFSADITEAGYQGTLRFRAVV